MIFDGFDVMTFRQLEEHIHAGLFHSVFVFTVNMPQRLRHRGKHTSHAYIAFCIFQSYLWNLELYFSQ